MQYTATEAGWLCSWSYGTPFEKREVLVTVKEIEQAQAGYRGKELTRPWTRTLEAIAIGKRCNAYHPEGYP